jgi:hypothetical protein
VLIVDAGEAIDEFFDGAEDGIEESFFAIEDANKSTQIRMRKMFSSIPGVRSISGVRSRGCRESRWRRRTWLRRQKLRPAKETP